MPRCKCVKDRYFYGNRALHALEHGAAVYVGHKGTGGKDKQEGTEGKPKKKSLMGVLFLLEVLFVFFFFFPYPLSPVYLIICDRFPPNGRSLYRTAPHSLKSGLGANIRFYIRQLIVPQAVEFFPTCYVGIQVQCTRGNRVKQCLYVEFFSLF